MVFEGSLLYVKFIEKGSRCIHVYILEPPFSKKCTIKWSGFVEVCRIFNYEKTFIVYLIMTKLLFKTKPYPNNHNKTYILLFSVV